MTEPNATIPTPRRSGPALWRVAVVIGSLVVLAAGAALTIGASPSPSASTAPSASSTPDQRADDGWIGPGGFGMMRGQGRGGFGHGGITVTAVNGSNLALETDDGWTRTITVTSDTEITKGGAAIEVSAIKVGDDIVFAQDRQTDGSYTITAVEVVVPVVGGTVGDVTSSGFTLTDRDGVTWTVSVSASTTYTVDGEDGDSADVKTGLDAVVQGTQSGNTITATAVHVRQPHAVGRVTAKTASTITIERRGGTTLTIKVTNATTYTVNGESGALDDVTVGMVLAATGTAEGDGTFSATAVRAGDRGGLGMGLGSGDGFGPGMGRGFGHGRGPGALGGSPWDAAPDTSPDASPSASGSTG